MQLENQTRLSALRTAIVGYHDPYHDATSGYDQFHPFVDAEWIDIRPQLDRRLPLVGRLAGRLHAERSLLRRLRGFDLTHFIYPEAHLLFADLAERDAMRSVVTLHLPFSWYFEQRARDGFRLWAMNRGLIRALRRCAGAILLDDLELERWSVALPAAKFAVIPHGVADLADWTQPLPRDGGHRSIAVIGRNCRDWPMLHRVLTLAGDDHPDWRFHLVGVPAMARALATHFPNVVAHPRLSHDDYLRLLAGSDANFLPVTFASANNALLESHSLGVPSVMTDTGGARRYSLSTTRLFVDAAGAIEGLTEILESPETAMLRETTRREGARFSWSSLATQFRAFYDEVARKT